MTRDISIEPHGFRGWRGAAIAMSREGLGSLRDRIHFGRANRGCRSAQPPANSSHPSGMAGAAQAGGLSAISRWLRSNATTPPVAGRQMVRIPEGCQRRTPLAARVDEHLKKMRAVWK